MVTTGAARSCAGVAGRRRPRVLEGAPRRRYSPPGGPALLPQRPFELAAWSRPKVAPDAPARVGRTLYSLQYRLIGQRLGARATGTMVWFYLVGELIKTHPFQGRGRRTERPGSRAIFESNTARRRSGPRWAGRPPSLAIGFVCLASRRAPGARSEV
jgi:hypothetical protein